MAYFLDFSVGSLIGMPNSLAIGESIGMVRARVLFVFTSFQSYYTHSASNLTVDLAVDSKE